MMRRRKKSPLSTRGWHLVLVGLVLGGLLLIADGVWIKAKAQLAQVLLERAFARTVAGEKNVRPWPWADISPVAQMSVDRLKQHSTILASASGEALAFGPALVSGTPGPGMTGTSVIAAHRDTHFSWIRNLKAGDIIKITNSNGSLSRFKVTGSRVARFDRSGLDANAPGRHLALTTCYPFDAKTRSPLRYIVEAEID